MHAGFAHAVWDLRVRRKVDQRLVTMSNWVQAKVKNLETNQFISLAFV